MTAKEAREIVVEMGLSEEVVTRIEEILADYSDDEEIPNEVIDRILLIVDAEVETVELAEEIYQGGAELADEFLEKVDQESAKINEEINSKL